VSPQQGRWSSSPGIASPPTRLSPTSRSLAREARPPSTGRSCAPRLRTGPIAGPRLLLKSPVRPWQGPRTKRGFTGTLYDPCVRWSTCGLVSRPVEVCVDTTAPRQRESHHGRYTVVRGVRRNLTGSAHDSRTRPSQVQRGARAQRPRHPDGRSVIPGSDVATTASSQRAPGQQPPPRPGQAVLCAFQVGCGCNRTPYGCDERVGQGDPGLGVDEPSGLKRALQEEEPDRDADYQQVGPPGGEHAADPTTGGGWSGPRTSGPRSGSTSWRRRRAPASRRRPRRTRPEMTATVVVAAMIQFIRPAAYGLPPWGSSM